MTTTITPEQAKQPVERPQQQWALWYRASRFEAWVMLFVANSVADLNSAMRSGPKHGDYLARPMDAPDPNNE